MGGGTQRPEIADLFQSKSDRALVAGWVLLAQTIAAAPAFAVDPAPLDDATLRQSSAPTVHDDRNADQHGLRSGQTGKPGGRETVSAELSQIVRAPEIEMKSATPEPPFGLSIQPASNGLPGPGTNFVISANLSTAVAP